MVIIENNIVLYSSPTCSQCKFLKSKLQSIGAQYEEVLDIDLMIDKGIMSVPVLEVNNSMKNFNEAMQWVASIKTKEEGIE